MISILAYSAGACQLMSPSQKKVNVFIVSDATGITAERVINAVLVQFKQIQPILKKFSFVKTKTQIKDILSMAEELDAIVIYSLVSKELRS